MQKRIDYIFLILSGLNFNMQYISLAKDMEICKKNLKLEYPYMVVIFKVKGSTKVSRHPN